MKKIFSWDELVFMVSALNGVICSPGTFAANLWGHVPYSGEVGSRIEPNILLGKVSSLSSSELDILHSQVADFWEGQDVIPSIRDRMKAVGLLEWEK